MHAYEVPPDAQPPAEAVDEAVGGDVVYLTRHGRPVAKVSPVDEDDLIDYVLANAPEYVADMAEAEERFARGERGRPLAEILDELDREDA